MKEGSAPRLAASLAPEHNWTAASKVIRPSLRPIGTVGTDGRDLRLPTTHAGPGTPIVAEGPAGLPFVYVLPGAGFEVVVSVEHLLAWGVGPDQVHDAAISNLGAWSDAAAWEDESNGNRRLTWSEAGEGQDAARILLPQVRDRLVSTLGSGGRRILVGLPERDVLIATGLEVDDVEFVAMFAEYVADRALAADEPIDGRVFELIGDQLVELQA